MSLLTLLRRRGTSTPFAPSSLSGLALWAVASDIAQADSTGIASVPERSGSGAVIDQPTGANQPIFHTSPDRVSGLTSNRFFQVSNLPPTSSGAITVFMVARAASSSTQYMLGLPGTTNSALQIGDGYWEGNQGNILCPSGLTMPLNTWTILSATGDTSNASMPLIATTLNGKYSARQQNKNGANWAAASSTSAYIGAYASGAATSCFNGDWREIIIYSRALSASEHAQVSAYLAAKYSIALATPLYNVVIDGNSLVTGVAVTVSNIDRVVAALADTYRVTNTGVSGIRTSVMITNYAAKIPGLYDASYTRNILCCWEGTNALAQSATATAAYNDIVTYCGLARATGFLVAVATILPRSDAGISGTFEADRQTVNTNIRSNWATFADALIDPAVNTTIGDAGDELNTTYYSADKVHMTSAGYAIVAPLFQAAIEGLVAGGGGGSNLMIDNLGAYLTDNASNHLIGV